MTEAVSEVLISLSERERFVLKAIAKKRGQALRTEVTEIDIIKIALREYVDRHEQEVTGE